MSIDSNLWHAYASSFFDFERLPNQLSFIIVTAWNPRSAILSIDKNEERNQQLVRDLAGYEFTSGRVGDKAFNWYEKSIAVAIDLPKAIALANKYQQNAIYQVSGQRLFLQSCLVDMKRECLGNFDSWRVKRST
ncbi:DUF3293 domain-containing protein [Vibrio makurazakiensis]|uniref:DUF3293 domain-containing protein n=1 Tax=Vibrio makurazakiensis TaxID=2910250 RepID=UPI003D0ED78B